MAKKLEEGIRTIRQISLYTRSRPIQYLHRFRNRCEANVPARLEVYTHVGSQGEARLMCSWDTTPEDVAEFVGDLKECTAAKKQPV